MSTTATNHDTDTAATLRHYFGRYRRRLVVIPVASFLAGLADALAIVMLAQVALALAEPNAEFPELGGFGLALSFSNGTALAVVAGLTFSRFALQMVAAWAAAGIVADVSIRARQSAFEVFLDASWGQQTQFREGELQQLLGEPVTRVSEMTTHVTKLLTSSLNLAALLISALLVDARASIVIAVIGVVLFFVFRPVVAFGREMSARERDAIRRYSTEVSQIESMALEVQTFDVGNPVKKRGRRLLQDLRAPLFRRYLVQPMLPYTYQAVVILVAAGGIALLLRFEPADLAAMGAIALLVVKSLGHGQSLQSAWQRLHFALPFADQLQRAHDMHDALPADTGSVAIGSIDHIEARGLTMRYDGERPALDTVDFAVHRGESIGVVGPSGSGKTTLMHLLMRLRQPTSGSLLVNGVDLSMVALDAWYRKVALVPQECHLFQGTIAENIKFHRQGFTDDQIEAAARDAGIHHDVVALPDGYATQLGPRGSGLSGGQRQRVAIARALVGEPELLVMDEPTSALDSHAEAAIGETLQRLAGSITTIVVAHRLSTVAHCDRVMVFDNGRLTGFAPASDLATNNQTYRALTAV
ncbi:MAG: ABC transporter ATP-binding protein [Acidimicrobiales bacterium]